MHILSALPFVNPPIESEANGSLPLNGSSTFADPAKGSPESFDPWTEAKGSLLFEVFEDANGSLEVFELCDAKGSFDDVALWEANRSSLTFDPCVAKGSSLEFVEEFVVNGSDLDAKGSLSAKGSFEAEVVPDPPNGSLVAGVDPANGSLVAGVDPANGSLVAGVDPANGSLVPGVDPANGSLDVFVDPAKGSSVFVEGWEANRSDLKGSPPNGLAGKASALNGSPTRKRIG